MQTPRDRWSQADQTRPSPEHGGPGQPCRLWAAGARLPPTAQHGQPQAAGPARHTQVAATPATEEMALGHTGALDTTGHMPAKTEPGGAPAVPRPCRG